MTSKRQKIAYLGPKGSFSHMAAKKFWNTEKKDLKLLSKKDLNEIFRAVKINQAAFGVIPLENSSAGSVNSALDNFCKKNFSLKIKQEIFIKIDFFLLSNEQNKKNISKIYAHPMAIAQCNKWLKKNFKKTKVIKVQSNSKAARLAKKNPGTAAISNNLSAQIYKIPKLNKKIQDYANNTTRFLIISRFDHPKPTGNDKTSLILSIQHKPGSLYKLLGSLAKRKINMTRIESRIMKIGKWEYYFFIDIEGHRQETRIKKALKEMKKYCLYFQILGSYPKGAAPWD
ncbi:MAG: prephenate dehydratase [Candidatus Moranbacteria bacterium]|nr:prephenate dehydratase [Candidatus Moranbacteria bacterium]